MTIRSYILKSCDFATKTPFHTRVGAIVGVSPKKWGCTPHLG